MPPLVVPTGTVTGQVVNASSVAVAGALVIAKLNAGAGVPQSITPAGQIVPQEVMTFTDVNGFWSLPLVPNNNINPANSTYTISVPGMPDTPIQLNDTASHSYLSLAVGPIGATLQAVAQTIPGALTVNGLLTAAAQIVDTLLTAGQVVFPLAGGQLSGDTNLAWDNVNKVLTMGRFIAGAGRPWFDVRTFGADPTGVADSTAAINAAIAALPATGGRLYFPGIFRCNSQLSSLDGKIGVSFIGDGGLSSGAQTPSQILYTGSATPFISARSTAGFKIEGLQIFYNNAALAGTLIDIGNVTGDAIFGRVSNSQFAGTGGAVGANPIFSIDKSSQWLFDEVTFLTSQVFVRGRAAGTTDYSNVIKFLRCNFGQIGSEAVVAAVKNPGEAWSFDNCNFERLSSGAPGAFVLDAATLAPISLAIRDCWMGDVTVGAAAGTWINAGSALGLAVHGSRFGGNANATAIDPGANAVGIDIAGCSFDTFSVAVVSYSTLTGLRIGPNRYSTVTTRVSGGFPAGAAIVDTVNVVVGGHLLANGGPAPTLGALQTNVSSQSIAGSDTAPLVTVTISATPTGAGAAVAIVNFGTAYTTTAPKVVAGWYNPGAGAGYGAAPVAASTTSITIFSGTGITASATTGIALLGIGFNPT